MLNTAIRVSNPQFYALFALLESGATPCSTLISQMCEMITDCKQWSFHFLTDIFREICGYTHVDYAAMQIWGIDINNAKGRGWLKVLHTVVLFMHKNIPEYCKW